MARKGKGKRLRRDPLHFTNTTVFWLATQTICLFPQSLISAADTALYQSKPWPWLHHFFRNVDMDKSKPTYYCAPSKVNWGDLIRSFAAEWKSKSIKEKFLFMLSYGLFLIATSLILVNYLLCLKFHLRLLLIFFPKAAQTIHQWDSEK